MATGAPGDDQDPSVGPTVTDRVRHLVHAGDQAVWSSTALVVALGDLGPVAHRRAAASVLQALGIDVGGDVGDLDRSAASAQATAPLLQAGELVGGRGQAWAQQSDEALVAQGRASAGGVAPFAQFALPLLPGLSEALARPGSRMLDVGVGVAAMAVAYAELFPALTVVGLDVMPRALALAVDTVTASPAAHRVLLRRQDVSTLDDEASYNLAWLPAPFVPEEALHAGVPRVARALVEGGWVMLAHGKVSDDPVIDALNRFKTVIYGGTAIDEVQARDLLRAAGLQDVSTLPTPAAAPSITVGRSRSRSRGGGIRAAPAATTPDRGQTHVRRR